MRIRKLAAAVAVVGAVALVAGCSSIQPSIGQYGIVTGHGALSTTQVQRVVSPGQTFNTGSGTTTWYIPANVRNYVTGTDASNSDRTNPQAEITGTGPHGEAGMQDFTYDQVFWEVNPAIVNPNHKLAQAFLAFCLKYGCATQQSQNNASNAQLLRSSTPGWNAMLSEVFPHAIDNATEAAIGDFPPTLWNDRGDWPKYGDDIASNLPQEIAKMTGDSGTPFFCGAASTPTHCAPFTVIVNNVLPADRGVVTAYNEQQTALYAKEAGAARLAAARAVYGNDANWFLGMQDLITDCQAKGTTCTFYVGNAPVNPGK